MVSFPGVIVSDDSLAVQPVRANATMAAAAIPALRRDSLLLFDMFFSLSVGVCYQVPLVEPFKWPESKTF
jgi:hypothetical protein